MLWLDKSAHFVRRYVRISTSAIKLVKKIISSIMDNGYPC